MHTFTTASSGAETDAFSGLRAPCLSQVATKTDAYVGSFFVDVEASGGSFTDLNMSHCSCKKGMHFSLKQPALLIYVIFITLPLFLSQASAGLLQGTHESCCQQLHVSEQSACLEE